MYVFLHKLLTVLLCYAVKDLGCVAKGEKNIENNDVSNIVLSRYNNNFFFLICQKEYVGPISRICLYVKNKKR